MTQFISKQFRNLTVVLKAAYTKEVEGRAFAVPGLRVTFQDFKFETSDEDIIALLKKDAGYGNQFIEVPKNVAGIVANSQELSPERRRELKEAQEQIDAQQALKASHEEAGKGSTLEDLSYNELVEQAKKEGIDTKPLKSKKSVIEALRAKAPQSGEETKAAF